MRVIFNFILDYFNRKNYSTKKFKGDRKGKKCVEDKKIDLWPDG